MPKEKPILFSTLMVEAILSGRKTQTRRLSTKIQPGDIIWVRETTYLPGEYYTSSFDETGELETRFIQKGNRLYKASSEKPESCKVIPSIFMPKNSCRIWLQATHVKKENLMDISESDALSEGVSILANTGHKSVFTYYKDYLDNLDVKITATGSFLSLWEKINGRESLIANPEISAITFKVLSTEGRQSKPNRSTVPERSVATAGQRRK